MRTLLLVVTAAMVSAMFGVATGAPADGGTAVAAGSNATDAVQEDGTDLRSIELGETAEGELDEGDPESEANRGLHEPVTFQGEAGQAVSITMTSDTGDTYLILRGPDGEEIARNDDNLDVEGSLNSRIESVELPSTGEYTIVATSFTEMDTFPYTLSLEEGESTDGTTSTPTDGGEQVLEEDQNEPNDSCEGATQAAFGDSYEDLTIDSSTDEDYYTVELEAGQSVTANIDFSHADGDIDMELTGPESSTLDSSTSVSDGETVSATAEESGVYCIRVYGFLGATADYSLSIEEGATEDDGPETPSPGEDTSSGLDLRSIELGETAESSLDGDDPASTENRGRHEPVTFQGEAGQVLTITMRSDRGDTYLILRGPDGEEIASNDDSFDVEGSLNSRIENVRLPESGEYTIVATSFTEMDTFDYELSLEEGNTETVFEPDQLEPNENCDSATGAELGASYDGLNIGSSTDEDYFAVRLEEGQGVTASIDFSHAEGDIDMSLEGPDSSFSLDSSISVSDGETVSTVADRPGTYCIRVYGYSGATAEYDLDIEEGTEEDNSGGVGESGGDGTDLRSIEIGQTVEGSVDSDDPSSAENRGTYEPVTFRAAAGQTVTIDMESEMGDTYLILQGPNGEVVTENDDGGANLNSRIDGFEMPSTGEYTIIATSYWEGSTFPYTLSVQSGGSGEGTIGQSETADLSVSTVQATPGGTAEVTYELANTAEETRAFVLRSGLEGLPSGWEVAEHSDVGGTWRASDQTWLFQEVSAGGEVSPTATLAVPDDVSAGETFTFRASAVTQSGSGTARATASVTVEIRETTLAQAVDQNDNGQIDDLEILDAIEWWQNEEEVPGYGDTISDLQILDLIGMWQDEESVGGN